MALNSRFNDLCFYDAKMARGRMARFIVENPGIEPEDLKAFDYNGFRYNSSHSNCKKLVFTK